MSHVTEERAVLHAVHVLARHHVLVAGGGDDDVDVPDDLVQLHHPQAVHAAGGRRS